MLKEREAIEETYTHWLWCAATGESNEEYTPIKSGKVKLIENCYLCQYAYEQNGYKEVGRCDRCPYYKKYGHCSECCVPFHDWTLANTPAERKPHALAFSEHIATLLEPKKEKPKSLEHGDFGIDEYGRPAMCIHLVTSGLKDVGKNCCHDNCDGPDADDDSPTDRVKTKYGNIFKLIDALSENVEDWGKGLTSQGIWRDGDDIKMYYSTCGHCHKETDACSYSHETAYKIWHKLGAMLHGKKKQFVKKL